MKKIIYLPAYGFVESAFMNLYQQIAIVTGVVFIVFIAILALVDFNNIIMVLGFIGVIAVISGTVKVMLLAEKRKELQKELADFRDQRLADLKKRAKVDAKKYYCPQCFYQSSRYAEICPACDSGRLKRIKK